MSHNTDSSVRLTTSPYSHRAETPCSYRAEAERVLERVLAIYPHVPWQVSWSKDDEQRELLYISGRMERVEDIREGGDKLGERRAFVVVGISSPCAVPTRWKYLLSGHLNGHCPGVPRCHVRMVTTGRFGSVGGPGGLVKLLESSTNILERTLEPNAELLGAPSGWYGRLLEPFVPQCEP